MTDKTLSAVIAMQEVCAGLVMRQQSRPEFEPEEKDKWLKFAENDIRALDPFDFIEKTDSVHLCVLTGELTDEIVKRANDIADQLECFGDSEGAACVRVLLKGWAAALQSGISSK